MAQHSGKRHYRCVVSSTYPGRRCIDVATRVLSGGGGLKKALADIGKKMGNGHVNVGFMAGSTYPDGTPVAAVAFWNEYGDPSKSRPPRPFFRRMIAKESPTWAPKIKRLAKANSFNGAQVLGLMGEDIKGALQQSINDFDSPALAQSTIDAKGFAKPLIDSAHMLNSVSSEVKT